MKNCHTTKTCQSNAQQSQSSSSGISGISSSSSRIRDSSSSQHSCSSNNNNNNNRNRSSFSFSLSTSINSYAVIMTLAALLLPLTHARHLHDQLALAFAYDDDASASSSSSSSSSSSDQLPAWQANPFHGLAQSFVESNYDSDVSSSSSSGLSSSIDVESDSSYEEIAQAAVHAAMRELRRQRIRHRRSHNLKFFVRSQQDTMPEWVNPCGGVYQPDETQSADVDSSSQGRVIKRKYLIALRNNTMREYEFMRNNAKLDYGNYQLWQSEYKFLPNMTRPTNAVKLKTWYRHMQTFVGSFAYLGKAHYKFRKEHQQRLDESTHELHELLVSARRVLCDIETTINSSYPNSHGAKLTQVSRAAMQERLKFYTPADGSRETDERDLKFSKQLYYQYLDNMWKTLHRSLRKSHRNSMERRTHAAPSPSASISGSNSLQTFSLESSESGPAALAVAAATAGAANGCNNSAEC